MRDGPVSGAREDDVEIYEDSAGEFRWRRKAPNGEIIADSGEGYSVRADAHEAARRVNGDDVDYVDVW
jgi:uncharacterized protein YegP (UPF0339 family)